MCTARQQSIGQHHQTHPRIPSTLGAQRWNLFRHHVHVLFWLFAGESLAILGSWKKFTSRRINAMVKRRGMLWQDESYDHLIRDEEEFARAVQYILDNPRKAGLSAWPWVCVRSE